MTFIKAYAQIFMSCFLGLLLVISANGCASLMLKEKERALDSAYEKGKIDKVQYYSSINDLKIKEALANAPKK